MESSRRKEEEKPEANDVFRSFVAQLDDSVWRTDVARNENSEVELALTLKGWYKLAEKRWKKKSTAFPKETSIVDYLDAAISSHQLTSAWPLKPVDDMAQNVYDFVNSKSTYSKERDFAGISLGIAGTSLILDDDRSTEEGAPYVFKKSEDQKSVQSREQQRQLHSRFTVFVRNRHTSVINVVKFQEKPLPSTLEEFWNITGLDGTIDSARVVVKMPTGWEKLSGEPKDANRYVADDPDLGVMFQLSPSNTPNSSPTREEYREITPVQGESAFRECVQSLFNENPFTDAVPSLYKDEAIAMLEDFFRQSSDCLDPKVVALILAMPGSGKTRTVQEAARSLDFGYHKFRMSTIKFVTAEDVRQYVERKIKEICGVAGNNSIPIDGMKKIVIHFDEIQTMMKKPKNGEENSLVTSLAIACDGLVHDQEGRHRSCSSL